MTQTLVASATKSNIIGFDRPFTRHRRAHQSDGAQEARRRDAGRQFRDGDQGRARPDAAGAHILDVNAGVTAVNPNETEPPLLQADDRDRAVGHRSAACASIHPVTAALKVGLETAKGRPLVNSVTGEEEKLEAILPLVAKYNVPVVAISNDETGISEDPDVRFEVAKKIVQRAADYGIKPQDIVVDPLVMPIGAMGTAGQQVFRLVRRLREELKVNTTCGASNISFGMPNRRALTGYFLAMAASHGMTSAHHEPAA